MTKAWLLGISLMAIAAGCRKSPEPFEGGGPQEGEWQPVPPAEAPIEEDRGLEGLPEARAPMNYQEAMAELQTSTQRLRTTEDTDHAALVAGLRAMADAVYALPDVVNKDEYRTKMMTYADKIQTSDPASMDQADLAKSALKDTVSVLQVVGATRNIEGFDQKINVIDEQVGNIQGSQPVADQREIVAGALEQVTNMLQSLSPAQTGSL